MASPISGAMEIRRRLGQAIIPGVASMESVTTMDLSWEAAIRSIAVAVGQSVKAGDTLAVLDPTFSEADVQQLAARLGTWRPDVVHAHDWLVAWAGDTLKALWDVPLVATVHATERGRHGALHVAGRRLDRRCIGDDTRRKPNSDPQPIFGP